MGIEISKQNPEIPEVVGNNVSFTLEKHQGVGIEAEKLIVKFGPEEYKNDRALKQEIIDHIVQLTNGKETVYQIKDPNIIPSNATLWYNDTMVQILIMNYVTEQGRVKLSNLKEEIDNQQEKNFSLEEISDFSLQEKVSESPYKALIEKITEPIILGDITKEKVALTFDDGYKYVPEILDLLKEYDIQATFFITGENIKNKSALRKRAIAEGHQICNHTVNHYISNHRLAKDPEALEKEIEEREQIYEQYLGKENLVRMKRDNPFFRFPGGGGGGWKEKQELLNVLKKHGYLPIGWSYEDPSMGTKKDPNRPVNDGNKLTNGGIILLHFDKNGYENAKKCIEGTSGTLGEKGPNPGNPGLTGKKGQQKAVTLSELLNPETYDTPIGRSNIPRKTKLFYTSKEVE